MSHEHQYRPEECYIPPSVEKFSGNIPESGINVNGAERLEMIRGHMRGAMQDHGISLEGDALPKSTWNKPRKWRQGTPSWVN